MDLLQNVAGGLALVGVAIVVFVYLKLRRKGVKNGDMDDEIKRHVTEALSRLGHPPAQRACPECAKKDEVIAAQRKVLERYITAEQEAKTQTVPGTTIKLPPGILSN